MDSKDIARLHVCGKAGQVVYRIVQVEGPYVYLDFELCLSLRGIFRNTVRIFDRMLDEAVVRISHGLVVQIIYMDQYGQVRLAVISPRSFVVV